MSHNHVEPDPVGAAHSGHASPVSQHEVHRAQAQSDPRPAPTHDAEHGSNDADDAHAAHNKHAGHDPDVFRSQFWVVLAQPLLDAVRGYEVLTFLAGPAASERLESVSDGKEGQA